MAFDITQTHLDTFSNNNASLEINGSPAQVDDTVSSGDTLTAIVDTGYQFTTTDGNCDVILEGEYDPGIGDYTQTYFTCNGDGTATLDYNGEDASNGFDVGTTTVPAVLNVTQSQIDLVNNNNATLYTNGTEAVDGDALYEGDTISVVCDSGYILYVPSSQENCTSSGVYYGGYDPTDGTTNFYCFTHNTDDTEAERTITDDEDWLDGLQISTKIPTPEVLGANNVYQVTESEFDSVNAARFSMGTTEIVDYGVFILGLIRFPTSIPIEYVLSDDSVRLGDKSTSVSAPVIAADEIPIELGTISVPETYGDARDYQNTQCRLYLPYASAMDLDPNYVVGQDVSIEYHINCYDGKAFILVYSSKIDGEPVTSTTVDLGLSIPFKDALSNSASNLDLGVSGDNGILTPFIEISRNDATLSGGQFTVPVTVEDTLSNLSGYVEAEKVDLEVSAKMGEQEEIKSYLQNGVFI